MQRFDLRFAARASVLALALVPFACGGESSSDGSGGTSGGSGGSTSGGSGGTGGSVAGGGTAGCEDFGSGGGCPACGAYVPPVCENGTWTCSPVVCPDASTDANPTCASNQVPTVDGCLTCSDASTKLNDAIEAARKANAACGTAADCVLTGAGTACAGDCQIAVSTSGKAAFEAALAKLDADYCSGFVPVCGYSTPKCAMPTLECTGGLCATKFN
jgi:hypothetical protein